VWGGFFSNCPRLTKVNGETKILSRTRGSQPVRKEESSKISAMPQNVLIIGATGVIGSSITAAIVNEKSKFGRIRILTSEKTVGEKVQEIAALRDNGVEIKTGSLESEADVKAAYEGMLPSRGL
jgi:FlaA1/EpsC-like NDP-sugar epimerase